MRQHEQGVCDVSITQNSTTLAVDGQHGMITAIGPHDLPIAVGKFFGVVGESHIVGSRYGRDLVCDVTFSGYANRAALQTALDLMSDYNGALTGTVIQNISSDITLFNECTFLGFEPARPAFLEGSGVHGWVMFGRLRWRQRRPN